MDGPVVDGWSCVLEGSWMVLCALRAQVLRVAGMSLVDNTP